MPALEIMPQCATTEEAQRRANIERGLPYDQPHHGSTTNSSTSSSLTQRRETVTNDHSTQSPKASPGRLVRFVKRNLRGLRRRSYPPYDESDKQEKKTTTKTTDSRSRTPGDCGNTKFSIGREVKSMTPQHLGKGSAAKEGFSPIGVKYWPKIMEDEEEEPPEALQFDTWST